MQKNVIPRNALSDEFSRILNVADSKEYAQIFCTGLLCSAKFKFSINLIDLYLSNHTIFIIFNKRLTILIKKCEKRGNINIYTFPPKV